MYFPISYINKSLLPVCYYVSTCKNNTHLRIDARTYIFIKIGKYKIIKNNYWNIYETSKTKTE